MNSDFELTANAMAAAPGALQVFELFQVHGIVTDRQR